MHTVVFKHIQGIHRRCVNGWGTLLGSPMDCIEERNIALWWLQQHDEAERLDVPWG